MHRWLILGLLTCFACHSEPPAGQWHPAIDDFGHYVEEALREDFPERIDEAYDYRGLTRLIVRKSGVKEENTIQVVARVTQKDRFVGQSIRRILVQMGTEFRYVKQYYENGFYHVVFEMSSDLGAYNFIDLTVEQDPATGQVRIIDVYNYLDGVASSDFYADILRMIDDPSISNREVMTAMQGLKQIDELLYADQLDQALRVFEGLSMVFRQRALFLKRKIKILTFFSDRPTLRKAVREYEAIYPEDIRFLNFVKIFLTDDLAERARLLEGLDKYIGEETSVGI